MKTVAFTKTDESLARELILHFMKVQPGALKFSSPEEAQILIFNDGATTPADSKFAVDNKTWTIVMGDGWRVENNTVVIPRDSWPKSLTSTLEDILLDRLEVPQKSQDVQSGEAQKTGASVPPVLEPEASEVDNAAETGIDDAAEPADTGLSSSDQLTERDTFDPNGYPIIGILQRAITNDISIKFDSQRHLKVVDGHCLLNVGNSALKALCVHKGGENWPVQKVKGGTPQGLEEEAQDIKDARLMPLESLLWQVCHWISAGRRPVTLPAEDQYSLGKFPDLNRIDAPDSYVQMATLLNNRAVSMPTLAEEANSTLDEVFDFLFALDSCGYLGEGKTTSLTSRAGNTGVFRKIMTRFSRNQG